MADWNRFGRDRKRGNDESAKEQTNQESSGRGGQRALPPGGNSDAHILPVRSAAGERALQTGHDSNFMARMREQYGNTNQQEGQASSSRYRFSQKRRRTVYDEVRFAMLLDATSSMDALKPPTAEAQVHIFMDVYKRMPQGAKLTGQVVGFRDYCDGQGIISPSDPSSDPKYLSQYVRNLRTHGGGDGPEAIEYALRHVLRQDQKPHIVFVFGDAPAHASKQGDLGDNGIPDQHLGIRLDGRTAVEVATDYRQHDIPIYTIAVLDNKKTKENFAAIAQASGGATGLMDIHDTDAIVTMVVAAILQKIADTTEVMEYLEHRALPPGVRTFVRGLLEAGED